MIPDTLKTGSGEVKKLKLAPFQQVIIICSGSAASTIIQNLFVILKKTLLGPASTFLTERFPYLSLHRDRQVFKCLSWKRFKRASYFESHRITKKCQNF